MIEPNKDRVNSAKDLLVFVAAYHFVACYAYLLGYNLYFGAGLSKFTDASDIFGVSIVVVVPSYVFLVLGALTGIWPANRMIERANDDGWHDEQTGKPIFLKFAQVNFMLALPLIVLLAFWLVLAIYSLALYVAFGKLAIFYITCVVSIPLIVYAFAKSAGEPVALLSAKSFIWAGWGLAFAFGSALEDAQGDKFISFSELGTDVPTCANYKVLTSRGDYLLVADADNKRLLVSSECDPVVTLNYEFDPLPLKSPAQAFAKLFS